MNACFGDVSFFVFEADIHELHAPCHAHGICEFGTTLPGGYSCSCADSWSGVACQIPPSCSKTCQNDGVVGVYCQCMCPADKFWTGTSCETCGLVCYNGGSSDKTCSSCECKPGYTGSRCESAYLIITIQLQLDSARVAALISATSDARTRLGTLLVTDISLLLSINSTRIIVKSFAASPSSTLVTVTLWLLGTPVTSVAVQAAQPTADAERIRLLASGSTTSLLSTTEAGSTISTSYGAQVVSPIDTTDGGSSSDNSLWIYIGAGAGGFVVLLGIIGGCICMRRKREADEAMKAMSNDQNIVGIPMTSPKATTAASITIASTSPSRAPVTAPRPVAAKKSALPSGWEQLDDGQGNVYYYKAATGESVWERPTA
jgi:hypothetical protein